MFVFSSALAFFRRLFSVMTAALMIFSSAGGGIADLAPITFTERGCHDNLLSIYSWSFYDPTTKVNINDPITHQRTYTVNLAKNDSEFCQVVFKARQMRATNVSYTPFVNENGDTLDTSVFYESDIKTTGETFYGRWPDPLIPVEKLSMIRMNAALNCPFLIKAKTDKNTVPGDYSATVTVGDPEKGDGNEGQTVEVHAHVWDFTLPDTPSMDTAMGLGKGDIAREHGIDANSAKADELYKQYYELLLDHGVSAYNLPVDILSDEADAYMDDPRCTSFCIPYSSDEYIKACYEKLSQKPEWLDKAYFYPIDEPCDEEAYARYQQITDRLSSLFPGYNMVTPFYIDEITINGEKSSGIELQNGKSSIMCPESVLLSNDDFTAKALARKENGDKLWWYVCCGPGPSTDYCNLFVQQQGLKHRLLFWQQKQVGVEGLLYWSTSYWGDTVGGPWASAWTTPWTGTDTFGDGVLLYPGRQAGVDGPLPSYRLECVADGIQDYEYLVMAEKLLGKDYVDRMIRSVTNGLESYTASDEFFMSVRNALGNAIEKASVK